jgi:hypothetical protein
VGAWVACRPEHPHQILKGMCACAATSAKPTVALIVVVKNGFGGRGGAGTDKLRSTRWRDGGSRAS